MIGFALYLPPNLAIVQKHDEFPERRIGVLRHPCGNAVDGHFRSVGLRLVLR